MPEHRNGLRVLIAAGGTAGHVLPSLAVAEALSLPQARPLVGNITGDRTGLTGRYTLVLNYDFNANATATFGQPSLSTAVKEQWGLRFERGPTPFRLVTVERAQPPAAN